MIDAYFKRPLLYDYLLALLICSICYVLFEKNHLILPSKDIAVSTATDLSTVALTIAGFVLTLLTVLITFKAGAKIPNSTPDQENIPLFDLFFSTSYYYDTVSLLKNAIKSLIFVAVIGFSLKLFLHDEQLKFMFFSNVLGLVIIVSSLLRCLLILNRIVDLQRNK